MISVRSPRATVNGNMEATTRKSFCLLRWIEEDKVGIMPISAVKKDQIATVGSVVDVKYQSKFYPAEILVVSGNLLYII